MRSCRRILGGTAIAAVALFAGAGSASASAPTEAQKEAFHALSGKPAATVPAIVDQFIGSTTGRQFGVDAANVHRVPAPGGGSWSILPGNDSICVVYETEEGVSTCGTLEQAKAGLLSVTLISPDRGPAADGQLPNPIVGPKKRIGLAPDALAPAVAERVSGQAAVVAAKSGFYRTTAKNRPLSSLLSRIDRVGHKLDRANRHRGVFATPIANAAAYTGDCIPPGSRYNCLYAFYGGLFGYQHPLVDVVVASADSNWICGNAKYGSTWAGSDVCTNQWVATAHPYNGSQRSGWAGPGGASASVWGQAAEHWYE